METNIVKSRKRSQVKGKTVAPRKKDRVSGGYRGKKKATAAALTNDSDVEDNDDEMEYGMEDPDDLEGGDSGSDEGSDSGSDGALGDDSESSDVSDYDMDDVSDEDSDSDAESENIDFSDAEDSDSELGDDLEEGCRAVSIEMAEQLVKQAQKHNDGAVRRLIVVYGSFVRRSAHQGLSSAESGNETGGKAKGDNKGKGRRQARRGMMASRGLSSMLTDVPNRYAPSNSEVYNYVVLEVCSIMDKYVRATELSFTNERIVDVIRLFRRFLSSALLQLAYRFEDVDLCRCALNVIGSEAVMPWVVTLKSLHKEVVKLACSLLTHHKEQKVRIHAFQVLRRYLSCVLESNYHRIQISQSPVTGLKVERLSSQQARAFCNSSINFLLNRSYRTQISASSIERTLKNFGLFKLSQNCLAELYSGAPAANLYTFAFKGIRDLGVNVRREWMAANDRKKRERAPAKDSSSHSIVLPVYTWGFVEAVNVWVTVLVRCRDRLEALVYPLVTVITGAVKVKLPQIGYMPFILHMLTAQNQLADGLERFVPIVSCIFHLLEQLRTKDINKLRRHEAVESRKLLDNVDDIMVRLRLTKKQLHASETYRMLYRHVSLLLTDHVGLVSLHPSFPEFIVPVTAFLHRYMKNSRIEPSFRSFASKLLSLMEESASLIREKRAKLDLETRATPRLKLLEADAKQIPVYRFRTSQLLMYQHLSRAKVEGTLSAAQL
ncbi:nucleolar complex 2, putative [Babesia ovata]|uniref:Nucleolar complex 2, putative n=1 Tax=Babesia ovata TaxID=189622 RepID=A0A2H6KC37_9APIC|nr:nucleolar complex 2, putative [Babesia ovata]GBE60529.1 nucleolar complex 2, putative [Babesia ovata]